MFCRRQTIPPAAPPATCNHQVESIEHTMAAKCSLSFLLNETNAASHNNDVVVVAPSCGSLPPASSLLSLAVPTPTPGWDSPSSTQWYQDEPENNKSRAYSPILVEPSSSAFRSSPQVAGGQQPLFSGIPSSSSRGYPQADTQLRMLQALELYLRPNASVTEEERSRPTRMDDEVILSRKRKRFELKGTKTERKRNPTAEKKAKWTTSSNEFKTSQGDDSEKEEEAPALRIAEDEEEYYEDGGDGSEEELKYDSDTMSTSSRVKLEGGKKTRESGSTQHRRRATPFQAAYLEYAFRINPRPDATAKYHISQHIGMSTQRVGIWYVPCLLCNQQLNNQIPSRFQNKRARMKKGNTCMIPVAAMEGSVVDHSVPPVNHMAEIGQ